LEVTDFLTWDNSVKVVYDPGELGADEAGIFYWETAGLWNFDVLENITIEFPYMQVSTPLNDVNDGRETEVVGGAGIILKF
jgi:hypothetical protein